jgi:two-component system chemotaxis sensor kinase CheA
LHLDENTQNIKEHISVIIIQKNCDRIALLVDEIIGEREIVLKPLQEPLTNIPYVIGATMTGGNQINFVLNSSEIIKKALL